MNTSIQKFISQAGHVILGKEGAIKLALSCLIARGHLLIEDIPGVGKTTLAHTMAKLLGLDFQRIQFTSDLLPADIIGTTVFERDKAVFEFHPGPVFTNLLLADEINRATPKTQSALLEAMEEQQVTIDKKTYPLEKPFFVIATQNPSHQIGTFPLPESQLDRFLMCISLGYPDAASERSLLNGLDARAALEQLDVAIRPEQMLAMQAQLENIKTAPPLVDYVQALLDFSRTSGLFTQGLSPRAGVGLVRCAKAWALLDNRDCVYPEDIQAVFHATTNHRLSMQQQTSASISAAERLLAEVAIP
ncbi:MAG: AAA family ATPase [Cycloclasticus sp. symbiont of Poecilosclerida sp. M]|nr:MAG: AAA family ATPase [Cycloclasticus sp. symbiont of Poecilosclerida sp. M]